ncbi:hypothetical protein RI367_005125 [Sorochytrium milnesiophthora]
MRQYKLSIAQQPIHCRICGYSNREKRTLDPPPILQLSTLDGSDIDPMDVPFFVVHATLWSEDLSKETTVSAFLSTEDGTMSARAIEYLAEKKSIAATTAAAASSSAGSTNAAADHSDAALSAPLPPPSYTRVLMGSVVENGQMLTDLDGNRGVFFVFTDLRIRLEGTYKVRFTLFHLGNAMITSSDSNGGGSGSGSSSSSGERSSDAGSYAEGQPYDEVGAAAAAAAVGHERAAPIVGVSDAAVSTAFATRTAAGLSGGGDGLILHSKNNIITPQNGIDESLLSPHNAVVPSSSQGHVSSSLRNSGISAAPPPLSSTILSALDGILGRRHQQQHDGVPLVCLDPPTVGPNGTLDDNTLPQQSFSSDMAVDGGDPSLPTIESAEVVEDGDSDPVTTARRMSFRDSKLQHASLSAEDFDDNRSESPVSTSELDALDNVYSQTITAYVAKRFPGMTESTPLSRCFARQGVKMIMRDDRRNKQVVQLTTVFIDNDT